MYVYQNTGRLPLPELTVNDISDEEFEAVIDAYAELFRLTDRDEVRMIVIASGFYKHVSDRKGK